VPQTSGSQSAIFANLWY